MLKIRCVTAVATAICLIFTWASTAYAGTTIVDVSAGSNWRTTTDVLLANQWNLGNFSSASGVAATAPYGNAATTTLNENRMMWNCGADGVTECLFDGAGNALGTGPSPAYFGFSFELEQGSGVTNGALAIIADDSFTLFINGELVLEGLLADNLDDDGQPVPLILEFETLSTYFRVGTNIITVGAEDFSGLEYLFISGSLAIEVISPRIVDVSGGSHWRTTTDGLLANQWNLGNFNSTDGVAATAPYGNVPTTALNENRMMWNCGADGMTGCTFDAAGNALGTGPSPAFFGLSFEVNPVAAVSNGAIAIIADDFFRLFVNGNMVAQELLTDHLDGDGQPVPVVVEFATLNPFFHSGTNVITVGAEDFSGLEYLFISGSLQVEVIDLDGDGVRDSNDNCILIANSSQRDTNSDGYGNACDPDLNNDGVVNFADIVLWVPFFNLPNSGDEDFSGDGFVNFIDYALFQGFFLQAPGPSALAP